MRVIALGFLALLAACSARGTTGLGTGRPSIEVADAALRGGSPEIALQIAGSILVKDPDNEAALLTQGEALTALERPEDAGLSFSKALAKHPASVSARIGLGRIDLASDPAAAEALFLEAVQREPRNGVALNDLGIARDLQGRHADAQAAYRQALGVSPDMTAAQVNLALSMAMTGQAKDAVQLLRPLANSPGASRQVRHDLAAVLAMGGDKAEAVSILSKDLPADEVQQALNVYASASPTTAGTLLTPGDTPVAAPVRTTPPAIVQTEAAQVQLAAPAESEAAAQAVRRWLQAQLPDVLDGHHPIIVKDERNDRTVWRLRIAGFTDADQATAFCEPVRAAGISCVMTQ